MGMMLQRQGSIRSVQRPEIQRQGSTRSGLGLKQEVLQGQEIQRLGSMRSGLGLKQEVLQSQQVPQRPESENSDSRQELVQNRPEGEAAASVAAACQARRASSSSSSERPSSSNGGVENNGQNHLFGVLDRPDSDGDSASGDDDDDDCDREASGSAYGNSSQAGSEWSVATSISRHTGQAVSVRHSEAIPDSTLMDMMLQRQEGPAADAAAAACQARRRSESRESDVGSDFDCASDRASGYCPSEAGSQWSVATSTSSRISTRSSRSVSAIPDSVLMGMMIQRQEGATAAAVAAACQARRRSESRPGSSNGGSNSDYAGSEFAEGYCPSEAGSEWSVADASLRHASTASRFRSGVQAVMALNKMQRLMQEIKKSKAASYACVNPSPPSCASTESRGKARFRAGVKTVMARTLAAHKTEMLKQRPDGLMLLSVVEDEDQNDNFQTNEESRTVMCVE